jgi:transposase
MPQTRLTLADTDFITRMKEVEYSNSEIARRMGVTEGAIRYRIKRQVAGREDGRKAKPSVLDGYRGVIAAWIEDYKDSPKRPTLLKLDDVLREHHGYERSYDALRRYIRKHFPEFHKKGACIRVETPPGKLMFVDWKEDLKVQLGAPGAWAEVQALCFGLGFCRKTVVRFSFQKDLASFISGHQEAFREYGGLPEAIRPDCLRSAVTLWRGQASTLNERYRKYLDPLGVIVLPARPGTPEDKGKLEKRILDLFSLLDLRHHVYRDLDDLHRRTRAILEDRETTWRSGATGFSVAESFAYERQYLRPLPVHFPTLPVKESRTRVRRDGMVFFDGNYYQVAGLFRDRAVLCRHTGSEIIIDHEGAEIGRFTVLPRARGMVRLSAQVLEDPEIHLSQRVRMWGLEVARRQVQIYQEMSR